MSKSRTVALSLMLISCLHAAGMGNTGVLCVEIDGHVLVERLFECWSEDGGPNDQPACDPCVDVPLQTPGHQVLSSYPGTEGNPDTCAVVAAPAGLDVASAASAGAFDAVFQWSPLDGPFPARSPILRC
ncbi:MAG: hypothetical protein HY897_03100 [Deltaproteobacteria bacterium]|nr:hypothetical protein [Deltaproteobacteria bacterium]